jgi:hypothetical protein
MANWVNDMAHVLVALRIDPPWSQPFMTACRCP